MPLMEELRNELNIDGVADDFGTWHIYPEVTNNVGQREVMYWDVETKKLSLEKAVGRF